jgi:cytochrome c6
MIPNLASARRAFPRSGMALAAALALVAGSASAADIQRGAVLYSTHCAVCHGVNGTPVMPGTPNFRRMEGLMRPDVQLITAVRNGKGAMPGYFGILRERELQDVVAFLRTLN